MATTPENIDLEEAAAKARAMAFAKSSGKFPAVGAHLLSKRGAVLDLTRPIFEGMPMWFGHQKPFIVTSQDHEGFRKIWKTNAGFYARNLLMSEHTGTHCDAINEYDPDGPALDEAPLEFYWGEAVCLDVSEVQFKDPDPAGEGFATEDVIRRAEERLAGNGEEIRAGDICFLWFDYGDRTFPSQQFIDEFPRPELGWSGVPRQEGCDQHRDRLCWDRQQS